MTDLQIANMLADYHKECDAAKTLREKGEVQLKHARLIREALHQPFVSNSVTFSRFDLERAHIAGWNNIDFEDWFQNNYH